MTEHEPVLEAAPDTDRPARVIRVDVGPPRKPDWRLGMDVQPHHFQNQDRYHEQLIALSLRLALPRPWGVAELSFDEDTLRDGVIVVRRFAGIFPDGMPVSVHDDDGTGPPPRRFRVSDDTSSSIDVHIAVAMEGSDAAASASDGSRARFVRETALVADANIGGKALPLVWQRPNVRVLLGTDSLDAFSSLHVARVRRTRERWELDDSFVPPLLRLGGSPGLHTKLSRLLASFNALQGVLERGRAVGAEPTASEAVRLTLLAALGMGIADVTAAITPTGPPQDAFRALAKLVGALGPFLPRGDADVPVFEPNDLGRCFGDLFVSAERILGTLNAPRHRAVPLHRHDESLWTAELREPGIFAKPFWLCASGGDPEMLREHLPRVAKVGAPDEIQALVQHAVPGVNLLASRRPEGIPAPAHAACFRVQKGAGGPWANVVKHGALAIFLPEGFSRTELSLYVQEASVFG